ncbi:MAG: class I SAM-dependent methyltransferase [Candidatus Diapherotrites archaeon]
MEDTKKMLIETYDHTVKDYVAHEFDNPSMEKHYQKFLSLVPANAKILDAGCGPGNAAKRFAEKGHKVVGIDLSKKMIEFAKKKVKNAEFFVMDVENISLEEKFDAVWAAFVLLHLPREKHQKVLEKFSHLLKADGILYLGLIEGEGETIMAEPYNRKYKQYFVRVSKTEIEQKLARAGFEVVDYSTEEFDEEGDVFLLSSTFARKKE